MPGERAIPGNSKVKLLQIGSQDKTMPLYLSILKLFVQSLALSEDEVVESSQIS